MASQKMGIKINSPDWIFLFQLFLIPVLIAWVRVVDIRCSIFFYPHLFRQRRGEIFNFITIFNVLTNLSHMHNIIICTVIKCHECVDLKMYIYNIYIIYVAYKHITTISNILKCPTWIIGVLQALIIVILKHRKPIYFTDGREKRGVSGIAWFWECNLSMFRVEEYLEAISNRQENHRECWI